MDTRTGFQARLAAAGYIAEPALASVLELLQALGRPLLVEGDAGVGKTEIAKALARVFDTQLIRLQCYEGLDASSAVYEWDYQRQLLAIKIREHEDLPAEQTERHIFSETYLLKRPLLKAITEPEPCVLLIDEVDRADDEFEAYLLEVLSDFQISIPELGTIEALSKPFVVLTSNGTRDISDALRRRCLYYYLEYPDFDKELRIVKAHLPDMGNRLARQVVSFVQSLREFDLRKTPGIAETLDWATAILQLDVTDLNDDPEAIRQSLVCVLKTREDCAAISDLDVDRLIASSA
ncbi:MAG: AAA family ATPase [Woeseiaceae bacterium]|jgi:MoxR-like ATPase